ncbi:transcriptional regulator [Rhodobacteraceae bacterium RKSG542]|uniref:helix-turn-helix domain-containing protein n=1 Tax=Pseudovibrio flavus TaxID=2529854 RepID=UPI0012BBE142|nr:helix-turn-helix domain-containing protein [Pseudovibrio flavus]MTI17655.1 transcriptional regulator [Pseudovibrio flavus]
MINQSISNAIQCLQTLASSEKPMGIREMGRLLELDPAKVTRIMKTLIALDLVHQQDNRKYTVGWGLHRLSAVSIHNSSFYKSVIRALESVENKELNIAIGVLNKNKVVYLVHTANAASVAQSIGNYEEILASRSVTGIMLLSRKSDEEIKELIGDDEFDLIKEDVELARNGSHYVKAYPFNEYRMARPLINSQAVIALSNVICKPDELRKFTDFLDDLASRIECNN